MLSFPINYIKGSDIIDGDDLLKISDLSSDDYFWAWEDSYDTLNTFTSFSELKNITEEQLRELFIDPTGARDGSGI